MDTLTILLALGTVGIPALTEAAVATTRLFGGTGAGGQHIHNDPDGAKQFYADARALARKILTERWDDVERVAAALREHGRLDAAGFRKLVPANQVRRVELPLQTRSGSASYDASAGTVQVIWGTGARVRWSSYNGPYWEDLPAENADLDWMNSGKCPLLDSHNNERIGDVLGVVQVGSAFVRDGKGYATIKLSPRAPIDDIKAGTLKNISIGYAVNRVRQLPAGDDDISVVVVESYSIKECSIVGVPAEQGAEIRKYECRVGDGLTRAHIACKRRARVVYQRR